MDVQLFKNQTLGIGSYGKVCRARYGNLPCAAKVIHETLFDPEAFKRIAPEKEHRLPFKRFEQECEILHNLRHPNIIQYLGVYQDPDTKLPILLMELMDGNLTHFLNNSLQRIPFHIQVNFCHDIALALSFLHANKVIHRDLSSNNILLISNVRAKVTDFGMARLGEQATQFNTCTMCPGTDVYMPPEAVQDKSFYTEKIDCFSLGVLIIQILTQLFPAPGDRQEKLGTLPGLHKRRKMTMIVLEVERRKNHIDLVDPNHPLLTIALDCLKDVESERPSAQQICERVATLKESAEYTKSTKGADKEEKIDSLRDVKQRAHLIITNNQREGVTREEIVHLKELINLKDETLAAKEKEIEELKKQLAVTTKISKDHESTKQQEQPLQSEKGPKTEYPNYLTSDDLDQQPELPKEAMPSDSVENLYKSEYDTGLPHLVFIDKPWYHGVLSQHEAEKRMGKMDMNTFLVRGSVQDKGNLILSVKNGDKCYHFPIDHGIGKYEIHGTHTPFSSVQELVNYYMHNGLPESSGGKLIQLIMPCSSGIPQPVRPRKQHDYNIIDDGADDHDTSQFKVHDDHADVYGPLSPTRSRLKAVSVYGHARAQFIPQKKHRRSQAPTEQVEPDHGVPIPTPEAANANTPPQKPESGRFGKSVFYDNLMEETKLQSIQEDIYDNVEEYHQPAIGENELYSQIKACGIRKIPSNLIQINDYLGSGQFGSVFKGVWIDESDARSVPVAVKLLKEGASQMDKVKFLQEAAIMAQFKHPNVVSLYGVVSKDQSLMLIVELIEKGDLRNYLHTMRPDPGEPPAASTVTPKLLLNFSQQVALGMHYLSAKGFIHRDLAARNILVSKDNICKIADFGLSRDLADEVYYISQGGKIPVKWTAPEAILYKKYSTASDVWSYGCLLYEIWSLGRKPFEGVSNLEVIRLLKSGQRLPPPPGCLRVIYELMIKCWNPVAANRPGFRDIFLSLLGNPEEMLSIPPEALDSHHLAGVLGSPLEAGENMYPDLHNQYFSDHDLFNI